MFEWAHWKDGQEEQGAKETLCESWKVLVESNNNILFNVYTATTPMYISIYVCNPVYPNLILIYGSGTGTPIVLSFVQKLVKCEIQAHQLYDCVSTQQYLKSELVSKHIPGMQLDDAENLKYLQIFITPNPPFSLTCHYSCKIHLFKSSSSVWFSAW